jgi:hypothetical protein
MGAMARFVNVAAGAVVVVVVSVVVGKLSVTVIVENV